MNTAITGNEGGGFSFQNVGELNPTVLIEGCRIQNCGLKMLNMTSPGIIDMYIQVSIGSSFQTIVIRTHLERISAHYLRVLMVNTHKIVLQVQNYGVFSWCASSVQ